MNKEKYTKKSDIAIIGGSAAGVTAAITARRHYPGKSVIMVRKERRVLIPCGIPYVFGTIDGVEENLIPDSLLEKNGIQLQLDEAEKIDTREKMFHTSSGAISYDRLILATGSSPVVPPLPGTELEGVFAIYKNVDHLQKVKDWVAKARNVVVIGGGFIGVELADEIAKDKSKQVSIVEMLPNCLGTSYDSEFCVEIEEELKKRGIDVHTSTRVEALTGQNSVKSVKLAGGSELEADAVILGIGSKANVELARRSGIAIGPAGGIGVDRTMKTSVPSIYACGDCAEKVFFFGGRPCALKLASIATQEARTAGANLFETRRETAGTVGVWSTAVGNRALGTAGLTEAAAAQFGYQAVASAFEGINRHPGVMPGGSPLKLKLVFEKNTGVLLGGQVYGNESAGELVNAIAALVQKRMTADEIALFQMGTHPALTASPIAYHLVNAAEMACVALLRR